MRLPLNIKKENEGHFNWIINHKKEPLNLVKYKKVFYLNHELFDLKLNEKRVFFAISQSKLKRMIRVLLYFFTFQIKYFNKRTVAITFNAWSQNYFHWFTEVLPRIFEISNNFPEVLFIFPFPLNNQYQRPSLKALGVNFQYFNKKAVFANNLIFSQSSRKDTGHYTLGQFNYLNKMIGLQVSKPTKYIYIKRSNVKRCVQNDSEVEMLLERFGFEIIETDNLTLTNQITVFSEARCLISMHGAGLTNMLFMQKNQSIIEFGKEKEQFDKCYFNLSNILELNYYHLPCYSVDPNVSFSHADLIVDLNELEKILKLII